MIRLLIIDDSPTMRAILASRLADEDDIRIAGMAESAEAGRIITASAGGTKLSAVLQALGPSLTSTDHTLRARATRAVARIVGATDAGVLDADARRPCSTT